MEELAEHVGLSRTPCWRRVKRLEELGIILKRVALLGRETLGLDVTIFIRVKLNRHDADTLCRFEAGVQDIEEVVECYLIAGDQDYLLQIISSNLAKYEDVLKHRIINLPGVNTVSSLVALKNIKYTTKVPLSPQSTSGNKWTPAPRTSHPTSF